MQGIALPLVSLLTSRHRDVDPMGAAVVLLLGSLAVRARDGSEYRFFGYGGTPSSFTRTGEGGAVTRDTHRVEARVS